MNGQSKPPKPATPAPSPPPAPKPRPAGPAQPPKGQVVEPLDPNTPHARELAAKWSRTLAVIERELAEADRQVRAA